MSYFKNKKVYSLIGIFVFIFMFFSVIKNIDADVIVWQYTTSPTTKTYTFETQLECGHSRALFLEKNWGSTATMCISTTSPGYPVVEDVYEDTYEITPTNNDEDITFVEKYTLLAPIGEFKDVDVDDIGGYLNTFLKILIGLAGALAVIMIIIGGVEWMGTDSVFGKTEARKRITSAILGLIIALGSYALLNTINPDLLGKDGLNVKSVKVELETEPITSNDSFSEGEKNNKCPEGIITINTANGNMAACASIAEGVKKLISDAKEDGIILFGASYRSIKKQEELRAQNCGGTANIYNKKAKCNPPTAIPGNSMHEGALAVDFTCNGKTMMEAGGKNSVCYKWLKDTKNQTLLKNLDSEPWHWSTNGR